MKTARIALGFATLFWIFGLVITIFAAMVVFGHEDICKQLGWNNSFMQTGVVLLMIATAVFFPTFIYSWLPKSFASIKEHMAAKEEYERVVKLYHEAINALHRATVDKALAGFPKEEIIAQIQSLINERKEADMPLSATEVYDVIFKREE